MGKERVEGSGENKNLPPQRWNSIDTFGILPIHVPNDTCFGKKGESMDIKASGEREARRR